jgi:hypothetical protein
MRVDKLALTDKLTLVLERLADGKIRATSNSFVEDKVILPDQVLEVRSFEGKLRIARKAREYDDGDPKPEPSTYDPYGDDLGVAEPVSAAGPSEAV